MGGVLFALIPDALSKSKNDHTPESAIPSIVWNIIFIFASIPASINGLLVQRELGINVLKISILFTYVYIE